MKKSPLEDDADIGIGDQQEALEPDSSAKTDQWRFDHQVASTFDQIALREIPDYLRVLDLCVRLISKDPRRQPRIIDVGSATGEMLRHLHQVGYRNLYGVDASAAMLAQSFDQATLIHSAEFPEIYGPFDYVLNNWTLHFIHESTRYLEAIERSLNPGGTLILTNKVSASERMHELYYDHKRGNGVSEQEITQKRRRLEGVLTTRSLEWHLKMLSAVGFEQIEIINAHTVFITFMATKPAG